MRVQAKPRDNPVDYALFLNWTECLFVEAKSPEKDLNDRGRRQPDLRRTPSKPRTFRSLEEAASFPKHHAEERPVEGNYIWNTSPLTSPTATAPPVGGKSCRAKNIGTLR
jgi:hypothetical protein